MGVSGGSGEQDQTVAEAGAAARSSCSESPIAPVQWWEYHIRPGHSGEVSKSSPFGGCAAPSLLPYSRVRGRNFANFAIMSCSRTSGAEFRAVAGYKVRSSLQ